MKKSILLFVTSLALLSFSNAQQGEKNFIDQPYIEITGTAEQEIVPDMIFLRIDLSENDSKGRVPIEDQENSMKNALATIGIDVQKDLKVGDFSSVYIKYGLREKTIITSKQYTLLVHDAETAGKAVKALGDINISNISVAGVDHSQMQQKRFDLRLEAVKAAKAKAEAIAETLGQKAGKALYVAENSEYMPYVQSNVNYMIREESFDKFKGSEPELSFRNLKINSSVIVRFALN
jgi:uncharacterized protein